MAVLPVRSALANLGEAQTFQDDRDLARLSEQERHPRLRDLDGLRADELPFELGFAILEKHADYLFEVLPKLIDRGTL